MTLLQTVQGRRYRTRRCPPAGLRKNKSPRVDNPLLCDGLMMARYRSSVAAGPLFRKNAHGHKGTTFGRPSVYAG
jgi:hypothetical protein